MAEMKESRDTAATTVASPRSHDRTTSIPLALGKPHISPVHDLAHPYHPHSPTASRKGMELFSGVPYGGRARSTSLGSELGSGSAYTTKPLLIPQSPPPGTARRSLNSLSLSPQLRLLEPLGGGPSVPFLPAPLTEPPRVSDTEKVIQAAVQAERKRTKEMEPLEQTMTADELRVVLKRERYRMSRFAADLARLRSAAVQCQAEAEIHEEGRINGLMRRLENLQNEKGRIIVELEREEEMLTNTLQKKLNEVRREKEQLEQIIAQEQLSHSELHSKVTGLRDTTKSNDNNSSEDNNPLGSVMPINNNNNNSLLRMGALAEESPDEEEEETEEDVPMES